LQSDYDIRMAQRTVWPGEIDVAPETLYDDSVPLESLDTKPIA